MTRSLHRAPVLVFLALGAASDAGAAPPAPADTRAELEAVCRRLTTGDDPFFGRPPLERARRALLDPYLPPHVEANVRGGLGYHLLRVGETEDAIRELERAVELLGDASAEGVEALRKNAVSTLAVAWLQRAEQQNCLAGHVPASCILPLTPEALHRDAGPARKAGDLYRRLLELDPGSVRARWLLNLTRMLSGDYPEGVPEALRLPEGALSGPGRLTRWPEVAGALGMDAFDLAGGAAMDDFDGDGDLDLVSSSWHPCEPMKAFRNEGDGTFTDVSDAWGLSSQLGGLNLVHADYDGDGMLDLLVLRGAWLGSNGRTRNSLLRNDLKREAGRFVDVTAAAGLAYPAYPSQAAAWADFDGDGDLDLYVGNESPVASTDPGALYSMGGRPHPSQLFRNDGDGTFTDVGREAGVRNLRFAKGVAWGDFDGDGDPDLYVSNIGVNRLYRQEEDGTFTDVAAEAGVEAPTRGSFATWFFDHDNDGDLDLFVADYQSRIDEVLASYLGLPAAGEGHPRLYRNDGGRFTDISREAGFDRPLLPMGANYGDLDNDGWLDVLLGTGTPDFEAAMPNVAYRNVEGRRFEDVTGDMGFGNLQKGHGIAFGDLDGDGDQDVYHQLGGAFPYDRYFNVLYANPGHGHHWVTLRLEGRKANRFGVGARIEVRARRGEGRRSVHALVGTGGSFGSSSLQQEIGLGSFDAIDEVVIRWPGSGTVDVFRGVAVDRVYRAVEGAEALEEVERRPFPLPPAGGKPHEHRHAAGDTPALRP